MKSQQSESTNIDHDFKNKRVNGPIACCKLKINRFGFDRTRKKIVINHRYQWRVRKISSTKMRYKTIKMNASLYDKFWLTTDFVRTSY